MVPYYVSKTLLFWNKTRFKEAGLDKPPASFDEILAAADKIKGGEKTGLLTLNFDWLYWPLMQMNGVDLLSPDLKKATFNTPKAAEVVDQARRGDQERRHQPDLVDRPLGRAQRGLRHRQCRHAACPCAGLLLDQGQGAVDQRRHAGRGADAGQLGDAQQPRPRHLQGLARTPSSPGTS